MTLIRINQLSGFYIELNLENQKIKNYVLRISL